VKLPPSTLTFTGAKTIDLHLRSPLLSVRPPYMPILGWMTAEKDDDTNKSWENKSGDV